MSGPGGRTYEFGPTVRRLAGDAEVWFRLMEVVVTVGHRPPRAEPRVVSSWHRHRHVGGRRGRCGQ